MVVGGPFTPHIVTGQVHRREPVIGQTQRPDAVGVQHLLGFLGIDGGILQRHGIVDDLVVQRQTVGRHRLHGRTGLVGQRGAVGAKVHRLFAHTAAHGHNVAVVVQHGAGALRPGLAVEADILAGIVLAGLEDVVGLVGIDRHIVLAKDGLVLVVPRGIDRHPLLVVGDLGAQRDPALHFLIDPQRGEVFVILVVHHLFHRGLDLGVHIAVDAQAAVEDHVHGLGFAQALLLHEVLLELRVHRIGVPGVVGSAGGILHSSLALHQPDRLILGGLALLCGNVALVAHQRQHVVAAGDEDLRVGVGVVAGGVLGDGGQRGTFRQRQLAHILAEILLRARLHAADGARQRDGVEITLQNGLLAVFVADADGTEDLADLAHGVLLIVLGEVLDELLFNGGRALLGAEQLLAGELVEGRRHGTLEVEAQLVGVEILVLHRHHGMLEIRRHVAQCAPDAVFVPGQRVIFLAVGVQNDGGLFGFHIVKVQRLAVVRRDLHHIHGQQHRTHTAGHHAHAEQASDQLQKEFNDAEPFLFRLGGSGGILGSLHAVGGDMPLLFGVYGDRLLWDFITKSGHADGQPSRRHILSHSVIK